MQGHGEEKFKDADLIATSANRPWGGMSAELRGHSAGYIGAFVPQNAEITTIIRGPKPAVSTRAAAGVRQVVPATPLTTWLCPAGIAEEDTSLSDDIPEVLHVYLPQYVFSTLSQRERLDFRAQDLRYQARVTNSDVMAMLSIIVSELRNPTFAGGLRMESLSYAMVETLARDHAETHADTRPRNKLAGGLDRKRIARVIDYIEDNLYENMSVVELAQVADYSLFHFTREFTVSTGYTPHAYLAERRLDAAKRILAFSDLPLVEIAHINGFSNQANFTKAFHKSVGMSPGRYRAAAKAS